MPEGPKFMIVHLVGTFALSFGTMLAALVWTIVRATRRPSSKFLLGDVRKHSRVAS